MTDPDQVFAKFIEANPVPDNDSIDRSQPPRLDLSAEVHGLTTATGPSPSVPVGPRLAWLAVAAACILAVVLGGLWLAPGPSIGTEPATPDTREDDAGPTPAMVVQQWQAALNAGDIAAVMELSRPSSRTTADENVHQWLAEFAASGMPTALVDCEADLVTSSYGRVICTAQLSEPVAVELGVSELIAPFDYEDGLLTWQPYRGGDIGEVNAAYAGYLRLYHPDDYETACQPSAYEPGSVIQDNGLALTGSCAKLAAPLAADVVQWIRNGRPSSQD